ncbi:hypothetical protein OAH18_03010 [bacterium]|nr:hypothetical protein [bacterium]
MSDNPYESSKPDPGTDGVVPPASAGGANDPADTEAVERLNYYATWLTVITVTSLGMYLVGIPGVMRMAAEATADDSRQMYERIVWQYVIFNIYALPILFGCACIWRRKNLPAVKIAAVMSMVPVVGPCFILAVPFGFMLNRHLKKPETQRLFAESAVPPQTTKSWTDFAARVSVAFPAIIIGLGLLLKFLVDFSTHRGSRVFGFFVVTAFLGSLFAYICGFVGLGGGIRRNRNRTIVVAVLGIVICYAIYFGVYVWVARVSEAVPDRFQ